MSVLEAESPLQLEGCTATARLSNDFTLNIDVLEPWLCRVAIVPSSGFRVPVTWMIAPEGDVPWEGRARLETEGFSREELSLNADDQLLHTHNFRISLQSKPLALSIDQRVGNTEWQNILSDRPMAAYRYLPRRDQLHHAQTLIENGCHLGLGDKSGALDRSGRRFRCLQTDALGYNAETSDPLYKHVPWLITGNAEQGYSGVFYDTFSEVTFDLGAEHSNYHDHYRTVEVAENALVYYVVQGPTLADIVPRFQALIGKPHLQPRWASGFAFTSMHHADADNAQEVIQHFIEECQTRQLPISAVHSGSGYTTRDDGRRYVFTWNAKKFPDREKFFQFVKRSGLHTCANIKSVLLTEHPLFSEVANFGGFLKNAVGEPAIEMFWGGPGASLDFTNPATIEWWQRGVKEQVLGAGFTATWNDNNECEIWDEEATLHGFGQPLTAMDARPVQALLMTRASFEAAITLNPEERPYTITRAGPAGISRYAQTWSGDNKTSWHTLRWNLANGLSMSLSGFPLVGHDIGGFDGPKPDAELLCRWVEMMALHPRAVMNSWKPQEDDPATLPWMHTSVESNIRSVLQQRYQFLPWLYHLSYRAHTEGVPVITPLMYHFTDPECHCAASQFMVGSGLLVAPVVESGMQQQAVYLPRTTGGWYEWNDVQNNSTNPVLQHGGQTITVPAPLGRLPLFIKSGSVLPIAVDFEAPHDATTITLIVFVDAESGQATQQIFIDDGVSWRYQQNQATLLNVEVDWSADQVIVRVADLWSGEQCPVLQCEVIGRGDRTLDLRLPNA